MPELGLLEHALTLSWMQCVCARACVCVCMHVCTWEASKLNPVKVPWWSIPLSKFGYLAFPLNHLSILCYLIEVRTWHPGAEKTSLDKLHANHVIDQEVPPSLFFFFFFFKATRTLSRKKNCPENHIIHLGCTVEPYKASKQALLQF